MGNLLQLYYTVVILFLFLDGQVLFLGKLPVCGKPPVCRSRSSVFLNYAGSWINFDASSVPKLLLFYYAVRISDKIKADFMLDPKIWSYECAISIP